MFVLGQNGLPQIYLVLVSLLLCAEETHAAQQSDPVTNPNWKKLTGRLSQVDIGPLGAVWGVNKFHHMFVLHGNNWKAINGGWNHVSAGQSGVWAVNNGDQVYYREGITLSNPTGTSWTYVAGGFRQIDSGPFGVVYGTNKRNQVYCRDKISPTSPFGKTWIRVHALRFNIKYVSCGQYGCWAITDKNGILFRRGASGQNCKGSIWITIAERMKQLEVDLYGVAYGVDVNDQLWVRKFVSAATPSGSHFEMIPNTNVVHVSAGSQKIIVLAKDGTIYQFQGNWRFTPGVTTLKQIDTGMTKEVWGVNRLNEVYRLERSINRWRYIGKNITHVSSGGAGVWTINNLGDVLYRSESIGRAGNIWSKVDGMKLVQIDSGPYGIVYGVDVNDDVFCRHGITPGKPTGEVWRWLGNSSKLSYISCGALGCWGVNRTGQIWYRHGVRIQDCSGTKWSSVPGNLRMIEVGADGNTCGVNVHGHMYHRVGVSSSNVLGTKWMRMLQGVSHVTTGVNGHYVVVDGAIYYSSDHMTFPH